MSRLRASIILFFLALAGALSVTHAANDKPADNAALAPEDLRPRTQTQVFIFQGLENAARAADLNKTICESQNYDSCYVALVDPKYKLGELRITPNPGQIVDRRKLKSQIEGAGYSLKK